LVKIAIVHPDARHPFYRGIPGLILGIHNFHVIVLASEGEVDVWQSDELEVVSESR
jgi:hypothetical protein